MQTTKLYVQLYENNIETGLKKKNSFSQPSPPPPEIPRPLTPHPSGISNPFRGGGGGYGYFLELHIATEINVININQEN